MLSAAHYKLDNLTAIIDRNNLQITGRTEDVCGIEPLEAKFRAFGWSVKIIDGHDITTMTETLSGIPFEISKPNMIIANTIKGKGVSFIENNHIWHHHVPNDQQYQQAQEELERLLADLKI
jgi:transketolase